MVSDRHGKPWSNEELDAVVSDYFEMLDAEISGRAYVKTEHCAVLVERLGRTRGSIELRHQNISALLEARGKPWIDGYKPMSHGSEDLRIAVDRYLSAH